MSADITAYSASLIIELYCEKIHGLETFSFMMVTIVAGKN
jgi:hypothetical protein